MMPLSPVDYGAKLLSCALIDGLQLIDMPILALRILAGL